MVEDRPNRAGLTDTFKSVTETEIQNKEVAALMGKVDGSHPDVLPGGLMSRLGLTEAILFYTKEKKRDKAFWDWLLQESIQRSLQQINDIIEDIQKRIEELLQHMVEVEKELAELDEQHEILEKELEYFQEQGLFDCDEHGRLKNPEAEAIVTEWEQKTGQTIDRTDPTSYRFILQILVDIEERQEVLRDGLKKDSAEFEIKQKQLDKALQIREDLQSGDDELTQKALLDFEGFIEGYDSGLDIAGRGEIGETPENDPMLMEGFKEIPEDMDTDLSFGFPPIQGNFAEAASGSAVSQNANSINPIAVKRTNQPAKPTN